METSKLKRERWRCEEHPIFVQSYGGAVDFANGFDESASFEAELKFNALFFEKIIVPDGAFYVPSPLFKRVQSLQQSGGKYADDVTLQFLRNGIVVPNLRTGESLLENWIVGCKGIGPGEWGYVQREEGEKVLKVIEHHTKDFATWPKPMAKWKKPPYAAEIQRLFVNGDDGIPLIGREQLSESLGLDRHSHIGWHALFHHFQESILTQIEQQNFRRGGLEKVVVDHFGLKRFNEVYAFLNQRVLAVDDERWPEVAVAHLLLRISSTVYEIYQAQQFNSIASLFPGAVSPVVDAGTYSRVVELKAGSPHEKEQVIPVRCVDPNKMSIEAIFKFRESTLFRDQYCAMLRDLQSGDAEQSFVDKNRAFYEFLEKSFLPAIVEQFAPAINRKRLEELKKLAGFAQAASLVTGAGAAAMPTLITHTSVLGEPLFAAVALASGAVLMLGKAIEKGADGTERYATLARNAWLTGRAKRRLNGFVAMQREAAAKRERTIATGDNVERRR